VSLEPPPQIIVQHRFFNPIFRQFLPAAGELLSLFPEAEVTSWWRSPTDNRRVGGNPKSQHLLGFAFDSVLPPHLVEAFVTTARRIGFTAVDEFDHVHLQTFQRGFFDQIGLDPRELEF